MAEVGIVVPVEGAASTFEWPAGERQRLQAMYDAIGHGCDMVELLTLRGAKEGSGLYMLVDEEALVRRDVPPLNPRASAIAGRRIVGAAVLLPLTKGSDLEGFADEEDTRTLVRFVEEL